MACRSGSAARRTILAPLLVALAFAGAAAAAPPSYEAVWREARAAADRGEPAVAAKMLDEALARAGASNDEAVWELRVQRAYQYSVARDYASAAKLLEGFPEKLSRSRAAVRRLIVQAMGLYYTDRKEALALLTKARDIAAAHGPALVAEVLYRRGSTTGNVADSEEAIRIARKVGDQVLLAKAEAAIAQAHAGQGRFVEAVNLGEKLLPRLEKLRLLAVRKSLLGNVGWYYSELGNYDRAAELLQAAYAEAVRQGDANQTLTWSNTLSNVYLIQRNWNAAVTHCETVLAATAKQKHRTRADALVTVARAYLELGRIVDARRVVREARTLEADAEDELIARVVEARIDRAERNYDDAAKLLETVLDKTKKPTTRLAAQGQLAQVYAAAKRNEQADKAFESAVALVRETRKSVSDKDLRLFFFNTTSELYDDYADFLVGSGQAERALRVTDAIRAQTLAEELDVPPAQSVDARKIARQRNATILCYWLGRRQSYLWTVTPSAVKLTVLGRNDFEIERAVEPYRNRLVTTQGRLARTAEEGRALYKLLVAPAAQDIARDSRVIVIPDGKLHLLNFETLVVPGGQPRYWIMDVVLSNASSLQLLARGAASQTGARMLIVGNPVAADPAFPALKQAGDEIARIKKQFPGSIELSGTRATPADYEAARPQSFDLVHFVAHGDASRTRPLDSAVILGPDKSRNYRLLARDIANESLKARLVTISSCHGAGSATFAGEGVVGLAWAFLNAGAQQVVAALWAVNDTAAPKLMEEMYKGINAGKEPAVALRDAKLGRLRSGTAHQEAMFWGPFVIYL